VRSSVWRTPDSRSEPGVKYILDVAGAMQDVDNFHSVTFWPIEDEPVLEVLHWSAAKADERWPAKAAAYAHSWHLGECLEAKHELPEKAFSDLKSGMLLQVVDLCVDFAPRERLNFKMRHLVSCSLALRSPRTDS
jgi:hypothetical protein